MRVALVFVRYHRVELFLDLKWCLAGGEPGAIADAENVRVDCNGRLAEGDVENDIGGLAPYTGQRLQRFARRRHLAAMLLDQLLRQRDDILGLSAVEADSLDVVAHLRLAELDHLGG